MAIENSIHQTLDGLEKIADEGGYVEKKEALMTLAEMSWFDNFKPEIHFKRRRLMEDIADDLADRHIQDSVKEELELAD
jgi:hypothetical protein